MSEKVRPSCSTCNCKDPIKALGATDDDNETVYFLFGSQTGTATGIAKALYRSSVSIKLKTRIICLNSFVKMLQTEKMPRKCILIIIASTFGYGNGPQNALRFENALRSMKSSDNLAKFFSRCKFAILGLGNSLYPKFCGFTRFVDSKLESLGGQRILNTEEADAIDISQRNLTVDAWKDEIFRFLNPDVEVLDIEDFHGISDEGKYNCSICISQLSYELTPNSFFDDCVEAKFESARYLTSIDSSKRVVHVEISFSKEQTFFPGDAISFLFPNDPDQVFKLLHRLGVDSEAKVQLEERHPCYTGTLRLVSAYDLLLYHCDICTYPSRDLVKYLQTTASSDTEAKLLETISSCCFAFDRFISEVHPSLLETLTLFSSTSPTLTGLLDYLSPLHPRSYSIGSCPDVHQGVAHIACSIVEKPLGDGQRYFKGFCSNLLDTKVSSFLSCGVQQKLLCKIEKTRDLIFPDAFSGETEHIVMIGPGTGVMPFRGYLHHIAGRMEKGEICKATLWLFSGNRHPERDALYRTEFQSFQDQGLLHVYCAAYSRSSNSKWKYVQDALKSHADEVKTLLESSKSCILICGGVAMLQDVIDIFKELLRREDAEFYIESLFDQKVIRTEAWGS